MTLGLGCCQLLQIIIICTLRSFDYRLHDALIVPTQLLVSITIHQHDTLQKHIETLDDLCTQYGVELAALNAYLGCEKDCLVQKSMCKSHIILPKPALCKIFSSLSHHVLSMYRFFFCNVTCHALVTLRFTANKCLNVQVRRYEGVKV